MTTSSSKRTSSRGGFGRKRRRRSRRDRRRRRQTTTRHLSSLSLSKAYEYWEKSYLSFKKRSFLSLSPGIYLYTRKDAKAKEMKEKDAPHPTVPQRRNNDVLRGLSLSLARAR